MAANDVFRTGFFKEDGFEFETRVALGHAAFGAADAGEVLATIAGIADGDAGSWVSAWVALGDRLAAAADASRAAGQRVSAAGAYLRAACAYGASLNVLAGAKGIDALLPVFRKHRAAWSRFCELQVPAYEAVQIPYEGMTLPGWFAACDDSRQPRPTLILNNGSDGPVSSMYVNGGAGALARGCNVLYFDGPGQQSMLFERNVPFRHDWEAVITPIVDYLRTRPDVDAQATALYGVSQAGYWVPRALAFEHRLAAAIADGGVVDVSRSWMKRFPKELTDLVQQGQKDTFNGYMAQAEQAAPQQLAEWNFRARPYGGADPYSTFVEMLKYRLEAADAARITTPLLVTDAEDEQFWPGQSAELVAMLPPGVATLVRFTAAEGANFHCEPMARRLVDQRMFDWLAGKLPKSS